jgi:hypothetical protein
VDSQRDHEAEEQIPEKVGHGGLLLLEHSDPGHLAAAEVVCDPVVVDRPLGFIGPRGLAVCTGQRVD